MAADNKGYTTQEIQTGLIILGVGIAAIFLLPPIIKILKLPGEILDIPGDVVDTLKTAGQKTDSGAYVKTNTNIPGVSTDALSQIINEPIIVKYNNTPIRKTANSNAAVLKYLNTGDTAGYVYSAVGEKLGNTVKIWISIEDKPDGNDYGWIALKDTNFVNAAGTIGCLNCGGNCNSCSKNISGINRILN